VVLFMYKKPTETKKAMEGGSIIGIGEFLLVRSRAEREDGLYVKRVLRIRSSRWSSMVSPVAYRTKFVISTKFKRIT
jgi:hypothetical protein